MEENFPPFVNVEAYRSEVDEILEVVRQATNLVKHEKVITVPDNINDFSTVGEFLSFDRPTHERQRQFISLKLGLQAYGSIAGLGELLRKKRSEKV